MTQSAEIRRVAVVTQKEPESFGSALERLDAVAREAGVETTTAEEAGDVDLAVVLGGDGTMLRALHRFLGTDVPVIGVNFGRVGFLSSMGPDGMDAGLARAFAGDLRIVELPTLEVDVEGERAVGINDVVCGSSLVGRMVELAWAVGGEDLGVLPCDGVICATPPGSTAYNLSSGGPVLVWGLDAMAVTFVSPHSLHARPLVVPRGLDLAVWNRTRDVSAKVIVDGMDVGELGRDERVSMRLGEERSLLATLPEMTFFRRYRDTFAS
jgi:NAD+ kinase